MQKRKAERRTEQKITVFSVFIRSFPICCLSVSVFYAAGKLPKNHFSMCEKNVNSHNGSASSAGL